MADSVLWITKQLSIVPRPRGGDWLDDDMAAMRRAGVDVVVSMLEKSEAAEVGLDQEAAAAGRAGMEFVNFAVADRSVPSNVQLFGDFLAHLELHLANGKCVGVHCRACIGRAPVVLASLLIRSGMPAEAAWKRIEAVRGFPVPDTAEQREWVNRNMRPPL